MGNSSSSSLTKSASTAPPQEDELFEEFSSSTTFGEVTIRSIRSTITNLTTSSAESAESSFVSYEEKLRDGEDAYSSTKTDSPMYQRRRQRLQSRGETSRPKLISSDTHPFFRDVFIELNTGEVAINPQFGLDYSGKEGTRTSRSTATTRRRRRKQNASHSPNEAIELCPEAEQGMNDEAGLQEKEKYDNDERAEEKEEDEEEDGGNLGDLKFVFPLSSSLGNTPTAFEVARVNRRRPRKNSFSAMGA